MSCNPSLLGMADFFGDAVHSRSHLVHLKTDNQEEYLVLDSNAKYFSERVLRRWPGNNVLRVINCKDFIASEVLSLYSRSIIRSRYYLLEIRPLSVLYSDSGSRICSHFF